MIRKSTFVAFLLGATLVLIYSLLSNSIEIIKVSENFTQTPLNTTETRLIECRDEDIESAFQRRGDYWVLKNFVKARKRYKCDQSITLTAPADYRFLDNVAPLVDVWRGPISVALYAPGTDFANTLKSIAYLRNCQTLLIKELVTFHVFFDQDHVPENSTPLVHLYEDRYDCEAEAPFANLKDEDVYKSQNNLLYPINVARNIAREAAQTYFIFPSDIELFPTPNFINKFLEMMRNYPDLLYRKRQVFVLPVFEIEEDQKIPQNKTHLQKMMKAKTAILFHARICKLCHQVPGGDRWLKANETSGLDVFAVGKRQEKYRFWEPFYVGTQREPLFDERLTWEGQSNKLTQAYSMCLLDYDFMVLDNAFLTHRPGIKKKKEQLVKYSKVVSRTKKTLKSIRDELIALFGNNSKCVITYSKL